jgi:hypothetical protein
MMPLGHPCALILVTRCLAMPLYWPRKSAPHAFGITYLTSIVSGA